MESGIINGHVPLASKLARGVKGLEIVVGQANEREIRVHGHQDCKKVIIQLIPDPIYSVGVL
jgi:hypothetical protein